MLTGTLRTALFLALSLFAACKSGLPSSQGKYWVVDSVPQRMFKHFTGYRADRDGKFIDYQYEKEKHVHRTLRRTFLGNSSDNPLEPNDPSQTKRRRAHSLSPDPLIYHSAESLLMGIVVLGVTGVSQGVENRGSMSTCVIPGNPSSGSSAVEGRRASR